MTRVRALVFDFDGLLVDTESAALRAWQETLLAAGVPMPHEIWRAAIGGQHSATAMLRHLSDLVGETGAAALHEAWWERHLALVRAAPPRPGVVGYLAEARRRGLALAVASSATADWVLPHVRRLGWERTFAAVCTGDGRRPKPAPDTYDAALAGLGVAPERAVAFEDSPTGVAAAKAAGLRCVAVPNPVTAVLAFPAADLVLEDLDRLALPDLLRRLDGTTGRNPDPAVIPSAGPG
jgi:HAD superfamily hydrolase (TIGR01509 family)